MPTTDDYVRCRRVAHRWDELDGPPLGFENVRREAFWLRCDRCGMVRAFSVSPTHGDVIWTRYWPPFGYYWSDRSQPAPTRQDYRVAWLREMRRKK